MRTIQFSLPLRLKQSPEAKLVVEADNVCNIVHIVIERLTKIPDLFLEYGKIQISMETLPISR